MNASLQQRLLETVHRTLASYPGAWMVWCDSRSDWLPLWVRIGNRGVALVKLAAQTAGQFGSPQQRREPQARLEARQSFALWVPRPADELGCLWAQALLAKRIYDRPLRAQLLDWSRHPQSTTIGDDELTVLA